MYSLKQLKKSRLTHLCVAITLFTSGLVINVVQLLLHLILKPINKNLFRRIKYYVCYSLYSQLIFITDWYSNSTVRVYMDADDEKNFIGKEHSLFIMNHTYEIDWLFGLVFGEKKRVLGNCKSYVKKVVSYFPIVGWAWKLDEFVFLERSFEKDKEIIARQLKEVYSYPDPTMLLFIAEGTRFTPKKHEASVKFAEERGMPVLKHHLIPRTKGFTVSLASMRGRCPVIYDTNLAFKKDAKVPPTISSLMNGQSIEAYIFVRRIPLENVPEDEEKAAEWLHNLYREKDRIIDSFHTTGSFFKTSGFKETAYKDYDRRLYSLLNFVCWALFSISLFAYYLVSSVLLQNWTGLTIAFGGLLTIYIIMEKAMGMTQINKTSNYGAGDAASSSSSKINSAE